MDLRRAPLLRVHVAAEPGTGRWLALLQVHHLVLDHTGLEVVLAEVAGAAGRGGGPAAGAAAVPRTSWRRPGWASPRQEHERYFAGLLGDVTEPTAPFGLLDVRGDGSAAEASRAGLDAGLAARLRAAARELGVSPATVFHLAWARVLAAVSGPR